MRGGRKKLVKTDKMSILRTEDKCHMEEIMNRKL